MPYQWSPDSKDGAVWHLRLWPHRSLTPQGFSIFIVVTFTMFLVPLLGVLGTPVLWALLPFGMGTLALTWVLIRRNSADAALHEDLTLSPDTITLTRHDPRGPDRHWQANPYWVRAKLHEEGGPVENYVTLEGGGRTVEIGAFLSPDERAALYLDLTRRLAQIGPPSQ